MKSKLIYDLAVVGGGPAGLAAAVQFRESCGGSVIVLERSERAGGMLPQCIHDGFGLYEFGKQMTGPEYAQAWIKRAKAAGVDIIVSCDALKMRRLGASEVRSDALRERFDAPEARSDALRERFDASEVRSDELRERFDAPEEKSDISGKNNVNLFEIKIISPLTGPAIVTAGAAVLATGCRERTRGGLRIPGGRPAGVYTAGQLQYMMNIRNLLPGRSAVILGSGDIGLIMARRMKWEGIDVKMILGQKASGLIRNYMQCVHDWDIPLKFGYTVLSVHGRKRLTGVTIAAVDADGRPDEATKKYINCDTLVVAAGLVPETEVWKTLFAAEGRAVEEIMSPDGIETQETGVFVCGNIYRQYDTVDEVSVSGRRAGHRAALYMAARGCVGEDISVDSAKKFPFPAEGIPKHDMTEEDMAYLSHENAAAGSDAGRAAGAEKNRCENDDAEYDIIYCINCPKGCRMTVSYSQTENEASASIAKVKAAEDEASASANKVKAAVTGNGCPAGERYAMQEISMPMRMVTTTVAIKDNRSGLVPVKTSAPVPKKRVAEILKRCRRMKVELPVKAGQVLYSCEDADIVICSDMNPEDII